MKVDTFVRTFDFCTSAVKILPIDLGPRAAVWDPGSKQVSSLHLGPAPALFVSHSAESAHPTWSETNPKWTHTLCVTPLRNIPTVPLFGGQLEPEWHCSAPNYPRVEKTAPLWCSTCPVQRVLRRGFTHIHPQVQCVFKTWTPDGHMDPVSFCSYPLGPVSLKTIGTICRNSISKSLPMFSEASLSWTHKRTLRSMAVEVAEDVCCVLALAACPCLHASVSTWGRPHSARMVKLAAGVASGFTDCPAIARPQVSKNLAHPDFYWLSLSFKKPRHTLRHK